MLNWVNFSLLWSILSSAVYGESVQHPAFSLLSDTNMPMLSSSTAENSPVGLFSSDWAMFALKQHYSKNNSVSLQMAQEKMTVFIVRMKEGFSYQRQN